MASAAAAPQLVGPRVLLHLPNWLGDAIMSTPLIEYLLGAFAAVEAQRRPTLHLLVRPAWAALFVDDTRLAEIVPYQRSGRHAGLAGIWRLAADVRRGAYDAVVLGPPSLRAGLSAALAGCPLRVGYATDGRGPLLRPGLPRSLRGGHHFSREMLALGRAVLDAMDLVAPPQVPDGLPRPALPGCAAIAPAPGAGRDARLWVVAPGTTYGQAKTWPDERVGEFIALAVREAGVRIVLVGDGQSAAFVADIRRRSDLIWTDDLTRPGAVVDLTGRTDLAQVVAVLKAAEAFVGNDSGLMHLAGALGVPTVGIFGSSNPDWTRPLGLRTETIVATGFDCRPCYRRTCNQSEFCLATITAAAVLDRVRALVDAGARDRKES